MSSIVPFVFNPFQENTYVISDDNGECIIIDPGCYHPYEKVQLREYIERHSLKPVQLIQTHCHVDHVLGNQFVHEQYNLLPVCHPQAVQELDAVDSYSLMMGIKYEKSPAPVEFLNEGDEVKFGGTVLKVLFTPGHSPGSISLYNEKEGYIISGDVLFHRSIGRTDLPGGSFGVLESSIRTKLYTLPDDTEVHSGHGPKTTIGYEKKNNMFVKA